MADQLQPSWRPEAYKARREFENGLCSWLCAQLAAVDKTSPQDVRNIAVVILEELVRAGDVDLEACARAAVAMIQEAAPYRAMHKWGEGGAVGEVTADPLAWTAPPLPPLDWSVPKGNGSV